MLKLIDVCKSHKVGSETINVLTNFNMHIGEGERIAITGSSGSGKSTLLNIMSTMDVCDSGDVVFRNQSLTKCSKKAASNLRLNSFGFVFQSYHLIKTLTLYDNIILPLAAAKKTIKKDFVFDVAERLGIDHRLSHFPHQLSGGEQQRAAVARALVNDPDIIFADEPTGNLDRSNSIFVIKLLTEICESEGRSLIIVTHDKSLSKFVDRVISIDKECDEQ